MNESNKVFVCSRISLTSSSASALVRSDPPLLYMNDPVDRSEAGRGVPQLASVTVDRALRGTRLSRPSLMGQTVAVTDCTLIDPRDGVATAHSSIVITGDRITARGPAASTRIPAGTRIVRASGKFVIPGLWDMHVHVGEIEEDWFPLYLANGLTGLREMAASEKNAPRQSRYQQDVASG